MALAKHACPGARLERPIGLLSLYQRDLNLPSYATMFELHTWGPGFGLPSIDAECLATIIYLQATLPQDSWKLIPSSNTNLNPFRQLPALCNDQTWIAGFDRIRQYLNKISDGEWDLDSNLTDAQRSGCIAYTAFLRAKGLPLLDVSLYVSSDNYATRTRSALGSLLSWPRSWVVPHQLREEAKRRSEHLGLDALDVDLAQEEDKKDNTSGLTGQIPKSLRKPKQTVTGLLGRSVQKTRFRLDAVTNDFLDPIHTKLGGRKWLVSDEMSSVDCLAVAILSLMQISDVPQAWLREALSAKYSRLGDWSRMHMTAFCGDSVSVESVINGDVTNMSLAWTTPPAMSFAEASMQAIETLVSSLPVIRSGYKCDQIFGSSDEMKKNASEKQSLYVHVRTQQRLYSQIVAVCFGTTSILGWLLHRGVLLVPLLRTPPSRRNFGEAGAILGL